MYGRTLSREGEFYFVSERLRSSRSGSPLLFDIHETSRLCRPLGGRHAAVIPALPEDYDTSTSLGVYHPPDRDRRETEEQIMSPTIQQASPTSSQQPLQPGLTQIVLPPPTTSETLNIQEYQPPAPHKEVPERRATRASTRTVSPARSHRKMSPSPVSGTGHSAEGVDPYPSSPRPRPHTHTHSHHTRSSSQASRRDLAPQPSPYMMTNANGPGSSISPPHVPATFASIMNAYPAPPAPASPRPGTAGTDLSVNGNSSAE